ncbi:type II toxin-antitoxin system PemK/MazF family toxin [Candidatus Parcubacteria bacterium]|nr:type II toxin-antitoxin system PemK/MazF family toxin [Candidatus Parcubacteria bacterium]
MGKIFNKVTQREIWLVSFPFSDFKNSKVRPVLIVSKNKFNNYSDDVIVCGITSNIAKSNHYAVNIDNSSLENGYLTVFCCIKIENVLKIDKKLLVKKIGKLKNGIFNKVLEKLNSLF